MDFPFIVPTHPYRTHIMVYTPPEVVDKKVSGFISADKSGNLGPVFMAEVCSPVVFAPGLTCSR